MAHASGNPTWTNTSATPATATALENIESIGDFAVPWLNSMWLPSDYNMIAWNDVPGLASASVNMGVNAFFGYSVKVGTTATVTGVNYSILTAGATPTTNNNYMALYGPYPSTARVAQTADCGITWASVGFKTTPFTSTANLTPGLYTLGVVSAWSTNPTWVAVSAYSIVMNSNVPWVRGGYTTGTYTAPPSTRAPLTAALNQAMWFGLY